MDRHMEATDDVRAREVAVFLSLLIPQHPFPTTLELCPEPAFYRGPGQPRANA